MSVNFQKKISIIIPTLQEAKIIKDSIQHLEKIINPEEVEIIVVDAESSDGTAELVKKSSAKLLEVEKASRAYQMNRGAEQAHGDILYFVHADATPPTTFVEDILNYIDKGFDFGCYRFRFRSSHPLLFVNSLFTRFKFLWCRGGDQTLFIKKNVFDRHKGFNEDFVIMEDFELIRRLKKNHKFVVMPKSVKVSARKYENNSYFRVNWANLQVFRAFMAGVPPQQLKEKYYKLIDHPKDDR